MNPPSWLDFWPSSGYGLLQRDERGWLIPTADFFALLLARPELALVSESCKAEISLHQKLMASPLAAVSDAELAKFKDDDARFNYSVFLNFRDALQAAGTVERYYQTLFEQSAITIPPDFVDLLTQVILRNLLSDVDDAQVLRAAELLFRSQQISLDNSQVLSADLAYVKSHQTTGGLGELGRLLVESKATLRAAQLKVLSADNASAYWEHSERRDFALDLTHEFATELGHGLTFRLTHARSGLKALARVMELWIAHFFNVAVTIKPESQIVDANWRWHIGLDVEATQLLNDLYEGQTVAPARMKQLVSLFRLDFADPAVVRADVRGKPVYLGLCMRADQTLKLKPQNLLLNLPLV